MSEPISQAIGLLKREGFLVVPGQSVQRIALSFVIPKTDYNNQAQLSHLRAIALEDMQKKIAATLASHAAMSEMELPAGLGTKLEAEVLLINPKQLLEVPW